VTLEGSVALGRERLNAAAAVARLRGVRRIFNHIVVNPA
jgi:hypothetical protein